jgi:hypothetical protein
MGMNNFHDWREQQFVDTKKIKKIQKEDFLDICQKYFSVVLNGNLKTHYEYSNNNITEAVETSRYSIEVNYRTKTDEVLDGFAKICLGYVSAALKNHGYHTKHVFDEKPIRLLVSSRNWDDGEWTGIITWNSKHNCFVVSKGFYNKDRKTVSIQSSQKCKNDSAADLTKDLHNMMFHLKKQPDKNMPKLKPVPLKRGPKK